MTKQLIFFFLFAFTSAFAQKKIEISDEKGMITLGSVSVIPYADGSFSICKSSIWNPYSSKAEYFIYNYDNEGNLKGSKKGTLSNTAPYDCSPMWNPFVVFDDVQKIWTTINTKRGKTEVAVWDQNLQITHSLKIDDPGAQAEFSYSHLMPDGKILFYKNNLENHSINRYEYDPVKKTLTLSSLFVSLYATADKKAIIDMQPAGIMDGVEYFIFLEKKVTSGEENNDYHQTIMAYTVAEGERQVNSQKFSLSKIYRIDKISNLSNIQSVESLNLYLVYDLYDLSTSTTGYKIMQVNPDEELIATDLWPNREIYWSSRPTLCYRGEGKDFHLLFRGDNSDVLSTRYDIESGEKSEITLFKNTHLKSSTDFEIFFPDNPSEYFLEKLNPTGDKKISGAAYIEDASGSGKLFLISYRNNIRKLEIEMYQQ